MGNVTPGVAGPLASGRAKTGVSGSRLSFEELAWLDAKQLRQMHQEPDAGVALPALDAADLADIQMNLGRQRLLRHPPHLAEAA